MKAKTLPLALTRDAVAINTVVNHPEVRPYVGDPGLGVLDLSEAVSRPENLFPFGEHGGFAMIWSAPFTYEVHTFVTPEGRGEWAQAARAKAIDLMRDAGAQVLWTKIPPDAPHVEAFAIGGGMEPTGEVIETFGHPHAIFMMEIG